MAMIVNLQIENFRCFREVSVPLKPLTVLIGANDTGKSSFEKALLRLFKPGTRGLLDQPAGRGKDLIRIKSTAPDGSKKSTAYTLIPSGGGSFALSEPTPAHHSPPGFGRAIPIQLPSRGPDMDSEGIPDLSGANELGEDGSGVPALLDYLLRRDRTRFFALVEAMKQQVPGLEDINVLTPEASRRSLEIVSDGGRTIPASETSAGVRNLLFYMALAFHPNPPDLLLIEEPEIGLHPRRLKEVVELLRGISTGRYTGRPAQVVLSTHSPYLLDFIDPAEDQVLVFRRQKDGNRTVDPVDLNQVQQFLKHDFLLGEIWYNQGEEGLIGAASI